MVYWLLSLFNDPAGTLGTDTGGKVATLVAMRRNGTYTNVDVGYWAARWDAHGLLHPLFNSVHIGNHWVQVTTLPMLLAGEPLYRLGGYRAALLLPMLGAIACAYAARALTTRFGADRTRSWWAFWIVGLASPVTIYALDFWEHTIGLAFMGWGAVALLDLLDSRSARSRVVKCGLAGAAFGAAATMRTEAFVYLIVTASVVAIVVLVRDRKVIPWLLPGATMVISALVPLAANLWMSREILGSGLREKRTAGAAERLGSTIPLRLREGLQTTFGLGSDSSSGPIVISILSVALIAYLIVRSRRGNGDTPTLLFVTLMTCVALVYVTTFIGGLGFVSGIAGAAPLAVAGAVSIWRLPANLKQRTAVIAALVALPIIWAFQWTGGAGAQWGGRYMLTSTLILLAAAVPSLPKLRPPTPHFMVGLSVVVTLFGLTWMSARTHDTARLFATLNARSEPVLVSDVGMQFVPREGGATYGKHRWLTTKSPSDRIRASKVVRDAGFTSFGLVATEPSRPPKQIGAFHRGSTTSVPWFSDVTLSVTTYRLNG